MSSVKFHNVYRVLMWPFIISLNFYKLLEKKTSFGVLFHKIIIFFFGFYKQKKYAIFGNLVKPI